MSTEAGRRTGGGAAGPGGARIKAGGGTAARGQPHSSPAAEAMDTGLAAARASARAGGRALRRGPSQQRRRVQPGSWASLRHRLRGRGGGRRACFSGRSGRCRQGLAFRLAVRGAAARRAGADPGAGTRMAPLHVALNGYVALAAGRGGAGVGAADAFGCWREQAGAGAAEDGQERCIPSREFENSLLALLQKQQSWRAQAGFFGPANQGAATRHAGARPTYGGGGP